ENRHLLSGAYMSGAVEDSMDIRRGYLYGLVFNPAIRTKPGKLPPAVVLQSDLVNEAGYPSTVVIPTASKLIENPGLLRLHRPRGQTAWSATVTYCSASLSPSPTIRSGGRSAHSRTT